MPAKHDILVKGEIQCECGEPLGFGFLATKYEGAVGLKIAPCPECIASAWKEGYEAGCEKTAKEMEKQED